MFCKKYKEKIIELEIELQRCQNLIEVCREIINKGREQFKNLRKSNKDKDKIIANLQKSIKNYIKENQ